MEVVLLVVLFSSTAWGVRDVLNYRHSLHLSVNKADNPELSLENLERVANSILDNRRAGGRGTSLRNPYETDPYCDPNAKYRTIDGTCNNIQKPWIGAAKTPLGRLTAPKYQDGFNSPRTHNFRTSSLLLNPRKVSVAIHTTQSNLSQRHSHLLMTFGQFTDHDMTLSPESGGEGGVEGEKEQCCDPSANHNVGNLKECLPIMIIKDPVFQRRCIPFLRSAPVPGFPGSPAIRFQLNDLTAYIDASQVYGSTLLKATVLRSFVGGKLKSGKIRNEEVMPLEADNPANCFAEAAECQFASGDVRNSEQASLTSLHTLLLREHNRIATQLEKHNPFWADEELYQVARKIIGAIMQRITYKEFLPEVLGPEIMSQYGLHLKDFGRFRGYSASEDPTIITELSTAAFRFGHSLVKQSFAHSISGRSDLEEIFQSFKSLQKFGVDAFMNGLVRDSVERCDRFISNGLRNRLFGEEGDLISFNIQRGRDHGLASYNDIRRSLNLVAYSSFSALIDKTHLASVAGDLSSVYPTTEDIEAFSGGISEMPLDGAVVGETFANIIGLQFKRIKYADRFWHENPNTEIIGFTDDQLQEIRKVSLASLYCNNIGNAQVRRLMLRFESPSNPTISCNYLAKIDLSKWSSHTPSTNPPKNNKFDRDQLHDTLTGRSRQRQRNNQQIRDNIRNPKNRRRQRSRNQRGQIRRKNNNFRNPRSRSRQKRRRG